MSRRQLLRAAGALGATSAVGALAAGTDWIGRAEAASFDGLSPFSMAMHIHSSFSEGSGSMDSHLDQAQRNGVKVIWWTDHDFRMSGWKYRKVVHFTSLTQESGDGAPWEWINRTSGPLAAVSDGGIVQSPASPNDTVANGSLWVQAKSTSTSPATLGFYAESHPAGWNYHNNIYRQVLSLDVLPTSVSSTAYLELSISTSLHPATNGRPAGKYVLSYRVGGPGTPGSRVANGLTGIVTVAAPSNQWTTLQLTPSDDIAALWPDMNAGDFACNSITLNAVSTGATASGYFDYLRFQRPFSSGDLPIQLQDSIRQGYATKYPGVTQRRALEMGQFLPHINWFGGDLTLPDYAGVTASTQLDFMRQQIQHVHAAGGLASYNHPYGYTAIGLLSKSTQDANRASLAAQMLGNNAIGCDIVEVGYKSRAGMDLAHHVQLWDVLSRNGMFLTGNGVTDDHAGSNWAGLGNNWVTSAWAKNRSEAKLLHALKAGRAWTASLTGFKGRLDLLADGLCPMGSVSVSSVNQRQLKVTASRVPSNGSVRVIRGEVDYAGAASPTPNNSVIATHAAADFATGSINEQIDTSTSCFVRTEVLNGSGATVAVSNPVWLLREAPPRPIPRARRTA
ncbi:MAG TPA: CehA/McbA family metallohydrolase [Actinomycetes bacterium]|nr:CehA/McbA family metallohydrolase [Actinomycetes bacterium]